MKKLKIMGALALSTFLLSSYTSGTNGNGKYSSDKRSYSYRGTDNGNNRTGDYSLFDGNQDRDSDSGYSWFSGSNNGNGRNQNGNQSSSMRYQDNSNDSDSSWFNGNGNGNGNNGNGRNPNGNQRPQSMRYDGTTRQPNGGDFNMNLYDGQDEQEAYSDYGFTRGDIYHIYENKFDAANIIDVEGSVEKVIRVKYPDGDCYLVAIISSDDGDLLANLGPVNYFDSQRLVIDEGDSLKLKGSKIRLNGRYILIVTQVDKDGKVVQLRSDSGQPTWKGSTQGSMQMKYSNGNGNGKTWQNGRKSPSKWSTQTN